ncbi:MAG: hypothetical protein RL033_6518 [Pseudomonadota bacterium]|jgi:hypothetical protein
MADYHDPTWLVQRAWSQFRLPKLQSLIELTIHDLERLEPEDMVAASGDPAGASGAGSPVGEALQACIEELREASGMTDAGARRAAHRERVLHFAAREPVAWSDAFDRALGNYRRAASTALQTSFAASQLSAPL